VLFVTHDKNRRRSLSHCQPLRRVHRPPYAISASRDRLPHPRHSNTHQDLGAFIALKAAHREIRVEAWRAALTRPESNVQCTSAPFPRTFESRPRSRIGVAHDAGRGIVPTHALDAARRLRRASQTIPCRHAGRSPCRPTAWCSRPRWGALCALRIPFSMAIQRLGATRMLSVLAVWGLPTGLVEMLAGHDERRLELARPPTISLKGHTQAIAIARPYPADARGALEFDGAGRACRIRWR